MQSWCTTWSYLLRSRYLAFLYVVVAEYYMKHRCNSNFKITVYLINVPTTISNNNIKNTNNKKNISAGNHVLSYKVRSSVHVKAPGAAVALVFRRHGGRSLRRCFSATSTLLEAVTTSKQWGPSFQTTCNRDDLQSRLTGEGLGRLYIDGLTSRRKERKGQSAVAPFRVAVFELATL